MKNRNGGGVRSDAVSGWRRRGVAPGAGTELPCIYAKISSGLIRPLAYVPCDRDTLKWYDYMGRKSSVWMISNRKG